MSSSVEDLSEKFRSEFPEFTEDDYPDSVVSRWIGVASEISDISSRATIYLAAHFISLNYTPSDGETVLEADGGIREVKREEAGPLEVEYFPSSETTNTSDRYASENFDRTEYGRIFVTLERRATAFSVRVWG